MSSDKVLFEEQDDIAIIKLNRPEKRNALDPETVLLFNDYSEKAKDKKYKSVVITGNGDVNIDQMIGSSNSSVSVICQIEEGKAVENINEIVNVNGIDCLFIGRADLAVTLGCDDINDKKVNDAIDEVIVAAKKAGISLGIYLPDARSLNQWSEKGFSFFIVGSDQSHLKYSISQIINN